MPARSALRSDPTPRRGRHLAVAAVGLAVVLGVVACSEDDETSTEGTATSAPAPDTSATTGTSVDGGSTATSAPDVTGETTPEPTVEGIDPMDDAGLDPVSGAPQVDGTAHITGVDVARHEGYDRVVFTFENGLPGYQVGDAPGPFTMDPSGEPVAVTGNAFLQVRLEPASIVDLSGPEYRQTYLGPGRIDADTPEITEVVSTGDFEAVSTWVIGVQDPGVAFRVLTLTDPPRLVVDVQNH